jgi:hypothetical protein
MKKLQFKIRVSGNMNRRESVMFGYINRKRYRGRRIARLLIATVNVEATIGVNRRNKRLTVEHSDRQLSLTEGCT